jgi:hypothetical protein
MPLWPRLETEGELEVRDIFVSHKDGEHPVNGLTEIAPKSDTAIYAWSLMSDTI